MVFKKKASAGGPTFFANTQNGNYPSILALGAGQALEKSRCFGQTGRAEGKNPNLTFG
jgi:hypothetical protein